MKIKFYNTLNHKIENFKPINDKLVKMYVCGPTVYNRAHIGNLSSYIRADVLRRILKYSGYKIKHVMNITDVGHLTSDSDTGEDKMEKGARREGKTARQIARMYERIFRSDIKKLNIEKPEVISRATEHIKEQVILVKMLEVRGYTYQTSDGIYFDTSKIKDYGRLANIREQKQIAGARVELSKEKKNPQDFALWKFEAPGEKRQMVWQSPWGKRTFPGWHIECSAMSMKYLGDNFDIHTGGVDHIGVHHSNEIAQNEAVTGKKVVNYWVHFDHILFENHKLSKSKGGFITLDDLEIKGFNPLAYRYLILTSNYRHKLNFTWKSIQTAQTSLDSLYTYLKNYYGRGGKIISKYQKEFDKAISENLDVPKAIALLWKLVKSNEKPKDIYKTMLDFDRVLGLGFSKIKPDKIAKNILELAKKIDNARKEKDYETADKIRKELEQKGYLVKNTLKGTIISKS